MEYFTLLCKLCSRIILNDRTRLNIVLLVEHESRRVVVSREAKK